MDDGPGGVAVSALGTTGFILGCAALVSLCMGIVRLVEERNAEEPTVDLRARLGKRPRKPRRLLVSQSTGREELAQRLSDNRVEAALWRANALRPMSMDLRLKSHPFPKWGGRKG